MSRLGFFEQKRKKKILRITTWSFKTKNLRGDFQMTLNCDVDRKIAANTENVVHVYIQRPQLGMKLM